MSNSQKTDYSVDSLGLLSIGMICLGYILFVRPFAELHIQFFFLNFPIFIGEILLFFCLCLYFLKNKNDWAKIDRGHKWIIAYFTFIVLKALYGYWMLGPLALRDAALFYYLIFILFGYSFYRRDFFTVKKTISLSLFVILIFIVRMYNDYWTLTCFILAFILICSLRTKWLKYVLLATLLCVTPYKFIFYTCRMMMVSNAVAVMYLMVALYFILKMKREIKVAVFVLCAFLVAGGAMKFMDRNAARSMTDFGKIREAFDFYNADVMKALDRYDAAHPKGFEGVAVYNPNQPISFNFYSDKKIQAAVSGLTVPGAMTATSAPAVVESPSAPLNPSVVSGSSTVEPPDAPRVAAAPVTTASGVSTVETGLAITPSPSNVASGPSTVMPGESGTTYSPSGVVGSSAVIPSTPRVASTVVSGPSVTSREPSVVAAPSRAVPGLSTAASRPSVTSGASTIVSAPSTVVSGVSTAASGPATVPGTSSIVSGPSAVASEASNTASGLGTFQPPYQQTAVKLYNPNTFDFHKTHEDVVNGVSLPGKTDTVEKSLPERDSDGAVVNALFRLFIWRDMLTELIKEKPILGFNFGKPLRSVSLEVLGWGESEWRRDGWIGAHNSYLNMIYRAGIVGLATILAIFVVLGSMIKKSVQCRSVTGILLCGIIINWLVAANFLLILELPYTAIPIWTLFGMTYAYVQNLKRHSIPEDKTAREEIK